MGQEQSLNIPRSENGGTSDAGSETKGDGEVSMLDTHSVEWEGYLEKKGHLLRNWKTRFCTLEDNVLSYYESKRDACRRKHLKGRVRITEVKVDKRKETARGFDFVFETKEKKHFHCAVTTELERDTWVRMIETGIDVISMRKTGRGVYNTHDFQPKVPDENVYELYKEAITTGKGVQDLLFYFSKDVIITSNYPRNLPFGGDLYGREGVMAYIELVRRNLTMKNFTVKSIKAEHQKSVARGSSIYTLLSTGKEISEQWKHIISYGPAGRVIKVQIQIDLSTVGDDLANAKAINNPFALSEDHPRFSHKRRALSLSLNDFTVFHVIGKGGFGTVVVAKKKSDGRVYALKIIEKNKMTKYDIQSSFTEMRIGKEIHHPFLASLQLAFQSQSKLLLGMKFYAGGDLFHHMSLGATCRIAPARARFYTAELVLALHHLHKHDILYRDLKPENVMIDSDGHIGLVDFGLAKMHVSDFKGAKTMAGSPQYTAPELLCPKEERLYGKQADWWSLGILLYEMSVGKSPFFDPNVDRMYKRIQQEPLSYPSNVLVGDDLKSLLNMLLEKDPKKRIGNSFSEISSHVYFKGIDWDKLLRKEITPPWKPKITDETCIDYIDSEFTDLSVEAELKSPANDRKQSAFANLGQKLMKGNASRAREDAAMPGGVRPSEDPTFRDFAYACDDPSQYVQIDELLHEIHESPHEMGTPLANFVENETLDYPVSPAVIRETVSKESSSDEDDRQEESDSKDGTASTASANSSSTAASSATAKAK